MLKKCVGFLYLSAYYLFVPAAPCSYSSPVSAAPAVPLAIPLLLAISFAASGFGTSFPDSTILSVISLFTAVGSCSFIFAGVIGSFSLYSVMGHLSCQSLFLGHPLQMFCLFR